MTIWIAAPAWAGFFSSTPRDLRQACEILAKSVHKGLGSGLSGSQARIGVRPFVSMSSKDTLLGHRVADLVTGSLSAIKNKKYSVVERLLVAQLMSEWDDFDAIKTKPNVHGNDADQPNQVDTWAGRLCADYILMGDYHLTDENLVLGCRVLNVKTSTAIASASTKLKLNPNIKRLLATPPPALGQVAAMEAISASGQKPGQARVRLFGYENNVPKIDPQGRAVSFFAGQKMGFSIRPPMDSQLYIINYDPSGRAGEAIFLYPVPGIDRKIFVKDTTYMFPEAIDPTAVSYDVDPPFGRMVFKVIGVDASAGFRDLIQGMDGSCGYYQFSSKDLETLINRLLILPPASWWEESAEFWVRP